MAEVRRMPGQCMEGQSERMLHFWADCVSFQSVQEAHIEVYGQSGYRKLRHLYLYASEEQ